MTQDEIRRMRRTYQRELEAKTLHLTNELQVRLAQIQHCAVALGYLQGVCRHPDMRREWGGIEVDDVLTCQDCGYTEGGTH